MYSFATRWSLRIVVVLLVGASLLLLARGSYAEQKTNILPSGARCAISVTTAAQYFPGDDAYGSEGQSLTTYKTSQGTCTPQLVIWYMYMQTRGWNNSGGWHIAEWHEDVGYPYLCCSYLSTPWTYACGGYVCDQASWYITTFHYYNETNNPPYITVYTSNDGQHSTSGCFFNGC